MNKEIIKKIFGNDIINQIENSICPICKEKINMNDFKTHLDVKEYTISGLCQKCQDKIFGA